MYSLTVAFLQHAMPIEEMPKNVTFLKKII